MEASKTALDLPGKRFEIAGNILHILHDPEERLQSLLLLIGSATHSLTLSMYMFHNDTSGTEVRDALAEAALRGVNVEVLIDSFGSSKVPASFFLPIAEAGGSYHFFSSRWRLI
jgi:cardiolipin synthase